MGINSLYCRTLIKSRPIRPLWASTFRTRTSTRSPGPRARLRRRWLTGSLSRVMLLLWMRPARPTPISTKAPKRAVLSTRPVSTAPTRRSLIDTTPRLKSACPKSEEKERKNHKDELTRGMWGRKIQGKIRCGWQLVQMFWRRDGKGDAGKQGGGTDMNKHIRFQAATQYLCLHTSTLLSILFNLTFHLACSWEIFSLSLA